MKTKVAIAVAALLAIYYIRMTPNNPPVNTTDPIGFSEDDARMATKDFYSVSSLSNETNNRGLSIARAHQNPKEDSSEQLSVGAMNSLVQNIVLDDNLKRADKISMLWSLLENQLILDADDLTRFEAIAGGLAALWPIELTDELIGAASDQSLPPQARLYLIKALVRATKMYTRADTAVGGPEDFLYVASKMESIRNYFRQLLSESEIQGIMPAILSLAQSVLPPEDYPLIEFASRSASTMPPQALTALRLDMAMANAENQQLLLPELLREVNNGSYSQEEKDLFLAKLTNSTESALSIEAAMGASAPKDIVMPSSVRLELLNFLKENEPPLTTEQFSENPLSADEFIEWFKPVTRLETGNGEERAQYITHYAEGATSPKHLVVIDRFLADPEIRPHLLQSPLILDRLLRESSDPQLSLPEKNLLDVVIENYNLSRYESP